jgi:uncharacterized protein YjiS (DUF1127 family)
METLMNLNLYHSQSIMPSSRPLTERMFTGIGDALRTLWRDHQALGREARAVDVVNDMNEHMLRDIGASDRLIAHAAAPRTAHRLSASLLAVGLIATATPMRAAEPTCPPPTSTAYAQAQMAGVFTGEFVNGAPVYRLPQVIVVADRKVELAKMEREEQSIRAKQARTKTAAKHPA